MLRRRRLGGQEMYEIVDVHGGCSGVPVWMTEEHWRSLKVSPRAQVALKALREVQGLLESLKNSSNESEEVSFRGVSDAKSKTKAITTESANTQRQSQKRG